MTTTTSPHLGQIHALLAEQGYEVSEPAPDTLRIREVDSGVSIQAVLEGDILFFSLTCTVVPPNKITPEIMRRVARGQANQGVDIIEDATFEATVRQTVADMKTELNNVVRASAQAMSNYNRLDAEYQKYVRQSQEWKDRASMALDAGNEDLA